ncbi:hypothetical protein CTEN210_04427 [Chaetoceros tenuissimus]|uniref:Exostosin GT47 domain-containing protein n=1 Tax=Chaetoceros tenuissimus TaxID=426638 RepID=A0AAD3CL56_9STRA|nr:hypothetical protein CTEN210_04427 [Chaetoceros tenuissimus]
MVAPRSRSPRRIVRASADRIYFKNGKGRRKNRLTISCIVVVICVMVLVINVRVLSSIHGISKSFIDESPEQLKHHVKTPETFTKRNEIKEMTKNDDADNENHNYGLRSDEMDVTKAPSRAPTSTIGESFPTEILRYFELPDPKFQDSIFIRRTKLPMRPSSHFSKVYTFDDLNNKNSTGASKNLSSLLIPKQCFERCCYEKVAISMDHEENRLKSTVDGLDVAEVLMHGHIVPNHLKFPNAIDLDEDILPCLQTGTIIHADSYGTLLDKFFEKYRPNITKPYVFIASETDGPQPDVNYRSRITEDPLLLHWYGNNPQFLNEAPTDIEKKNFTAFPLGLSKYHPQMPHLDYYLSKTNYTNPFSETMKHRWTDSILFRNASLQDLVFVNFAINPNKLHRFEPYRMICGDEVFEANGTNEEINQRVSCSVSGSSVPKHLQSSHSMHATYSAASQFLFGLSPPGNGNDCHRTYEFWFLGLIPIIKRTGFTEDKGANMFQDLPVIELDHFNYNQTELLKILQDYIRSDKFRYADFDKGWKRLFLGYWRQKILSDAGREKDLVKDEYGKKYFLSWKYSKVV